MVGSLILFVLFVIVYILISDVITIIFRLTGMSEETARFQAISLLTNSGFTTNESETVLASSLRRKIARFTMLFGYTFTVTIVSTTVNFFMSLRNSELSSVLVHLPLFAVVFIGFYLIRRSTRFRTWFDGLIERWGTQMLFGKNVNRVLLVERYGDTLYSRRAHVVSVAPLVQMSSNKITRFQLTSIPFRRAYPSRAAASTAQPGSLR